MQSHDDVKYYRVAIVSCDIRRHSASDGPVQVLRVRKINQIVRDAIEAAPPGVVVWSSGGDGGHVVFRQADWQQPVVDLVAELLAWSRAEGVPLDITCHAGEVCDIVGADRRVQLVGAGINYAGWLLEQMRLDHVVVSEEFRRGFDAVETVPPVLFHDERAVPSRDFPTYLLSLMTLDGTEAEWPVEMRGELARLNHSPTPVDDGDSWELLYLAKRIWQMNSADKTLTAKLRPVAGNLWYRDPNDQIRKANPLLSRLKPEELAAVVRLGQLVERREGEVICRYNDPGDSLFVILRGQVGVYNSEGKGYQGEAAPRYHHGPGEIVGELAFALARNRTADLVALTDVAMLSFNNEDLRSRLLGDDVDKSAVEQFQAYITERILEHVSDNVTYLLGPEHDGPLSIGPDADDDPLQPLRRYCEVVPLTAFEVSLDSIEVAGSGAKGICILVSGEMRAADDTELYGKDFPVLWADLPKLEFEPVTYTNLDRSAKVLRIDAKGVDNLSPRQHDALFREFPKALGRQRSRYSHDVFLCHASADKPVVLEVRRLLEERGIRCWYDDVDLLPGDRAMSAIAEAVRNSRCLLAFASPAFLKSKWTKLEVEMFSHPEVKSQFPRSMHVLVVDDDLDPRQLHPVLEGIKRVHYSRPGDLERLVAVLMP
ncbi:MULTISPECIES: TIR domain-containing protein [unclassified Saccharothrix]|uniref:TIR domain-containing protein n=1 Tax=unclassified Saccharothrix TaxID=2593673 RepID=UPI00307E861F